MDLSETTEMRAVRYEGPDNGVQLSRAVSDPECLEGWALVRPTRVGIGAMERALLCQANGAAPVTLGHEFVGIVESTRPFKHHADRYADLVGQRVVASSNLVCQECDMCRSGLSSHCRDRKTLGQAGVDGCFADVVAVPLPNLFVVPDEVDDDAAVFAEPLAAAAQAANQIRIEGKPYITVLGDGTLGLLCAQLLSKCNASVRLIGNHEQKVGLAEKWGVKHRLASDVGRRADQDVVIDCSGSTSGLQLAIQLVRPRGKIVLKSRVLPGEAQPCVDFRPIVEHEIELVGSRCGPIPSALLLLARHEVDVVSLITRRAKLDDAEKALRISLDSAQIKVLMDI